MRKLLLSIMAALFAITVAADDYTLSRCGGTCGHPGFGSSYGSTIQVGEQYTIDELLPYVGGKITRLRACFYIWPEGQLDKNGNPNDTHVTDLELWIKQNVQDDVRLRSVRMSEPEGSGLVWVEVPLDEPLEIQADMPLALGYTYTQDNTNPPAYFIVLGDDDGYVWMDSGDGNGFRERDYWNLSMEAIVSDLDLSRPRAEITGVSLESGFYGPGKKVKADFTYRNLGAEIANVTIEYSYGDVTKTRKVIKKVLFNESNTVQASFNAPKELTDNVEVSARVIAVNGEPYEGRTVTTTFSVISDMFPRNVVVEEGTGTWCGYCVRGFVAMEQMREKYPDTFIGIAVHSSDPMAVNAYAGNMGLTGYPGCNINRLPAFANSGVSPETFETNYKTVSAMQTYMDFTLDAAIVGGQIEAKTSAKFAFNKSTADLRMVYVVVEDGVTGYPQSNYYAGGSKGSMYGYENKPSAIYDQVYNDVARGIYPNYYGEPGSFASSIVMNQTYTHTITIDIPDAVQNRGNLTLVAMLLDGTTGEISQAHKVKLPYDDDAIHGVQGTSSDNRWYNLEGIAIDAPAHPGLYISNGRKVIIR